MGGWALMLSQRRVPILTTGSCCCVRLAVRSYQRGSEICERFAQSLHHLTAIEERELFDFGRWGVIPSL